jgi:F-type H+-transporting ATPase subunit c
MLEKHGKELLFLFVTILALFAVSSVGFAADAIPAADSYVKVIFSVGAMVASGIAIGCGAIGAGAGIGIAASGACQAVGRNPNAQGKVMMTMLIGMAMAESIAIYALVVSLVLLFANPFKVYFLG